MKLPEPVAYLHYPPKKPELKTLSWQRSPAASQTARGYVSQELVTLESAKQAVRDALEEAAEKFEAMHASGDVWISTIASSAAIRALIKEIPDV